MRWKETLGCGLALLFGEAAMAQAPRALPQYSGAAAPARAAEKPAKEAEPTETLKSPPAATEAAPATCATCAAGAAAPADDDPWGPTPALKVGTLEDMFYGDCKDRCIKIAGWMDVDYTYRSTGAGINKIAPVMNRFGDEMLARQLGLYLYKPLDPKELSWGFNSLFIVGSDASFLGPTAGGWANTNPRFGAMWTDLNLTAHLPILTEGGVDVKAGRQTTVLGPMGAIAWQRTFNSSDYAWYNLEEGRYTGVSTNWYINKQLSFYNGIEVGGWGVFFDNPSRGIDYLGQINYWLDCEAKTTKVWTTVLTGPTGFTAHNGNSTTFEAGIQHNYNKYLWQIVDFQMVYSRAPIFGCPPVGYHERAYDVYTYIGMHLNPCVDLNTRLEWYKDVDGGGYPGGFGIPHNDYYAATVGIDYHPVKWLQFRPEVRYDHATKNAFGANYDNKDQVSISADVLLKF